MKKMNKTKAFLRRLLGSDELLKAELSWKFLISVSIFICISIFFGVLRWYQRQGESITLNILLSTIIGGVVGATVFFIAFASGKLFSRIKLKDNYKKIIVIALFVLAILIFLFPFVMVHVFHMK